MTLTIGALLALSFLISVFGLFMFIWALTQGLMRAGPDAAQVIFEKGEVGVVEEPSVSSRQRDSLQEIESSTGKVSQCSRVRRATCHAAPRPAREWLIAAGNDCSRIRSRCPVAASSPPSRMPEGFKPSSPDDWSLLL